MKSHCSLLAIDSVDEGKGDSNVRNTTRTFETEDGGSRFEQIKGEPASK